MMYCLIIANGVVVSDPVPYTDKVRSGGGIEVVVNEDIELLKGMMKYFKTPSKQVKNEVVTAIKNYVKNDEHHEARILIEKHYSRKLCCDSAIEQFANSL